MLPLFTEFELPLFTEFELPLFTEFEIITAQQLCLERNRENPSDADYADAVKLAAKWNNDRIKNGLKPFQ
jgi:hypothetical protein